MSRQFLTRIYRTGQVAAKLEALMEVGLTFGGSPAAENEFKALLFRKMLDGRLGSKWDDVDERRFAELFVLP